MGCRPDNNKESDEERSFLPEGADSADPSTQKIVSDASESTDEISPPARGHILSDGSEVDHHVSKNLKPHQADGIQFMWKSCVSENNGCILAHSMGLGKTLQVVAFVQTFVNVRMALKHSARCIILTPCSLVANWSDEFEKWIPSDGKFKAKVLTSGIKIADRLKILQSWMESTSPTCLITSYETFCMLTEMKDKEEMSSILLDGPDLAVFDEGHRLKNDKSRVGKILRKLSTKRL